MAAVDLLFKESPLTQPANLVFGDTEATGDSDITISAALPALTLSAVVGPLSQIDVAATLPALSMSVSLHWDSLVSRPTVGQVAVDHQSAKPTEAGTEAGFVSAVKLQPGVKVSHQTATSRESGSEIAFQHADALRTGPLTTKHSDTLRVPAGEHRTDWAEMLHDRRQQRSSRFQNAMRVPAGDRRTDWQERYRDRRPRRESSWQTAMRLGRQWYDGFTEALPLPIARWSRFQEAIRPPAGTTQGPIVPPYNPCYTPSGDLLFSSIAAINGDLVFICDNHPPEPGGETVVVPIRSVYVVINNVSMRRVAGDIPIPAYSISLSIDTDSWTWGFSASVPGAALGDLQPDVNGPAELEVAINGNLYRVLAESLTRDRSFNDSRIRIQGRGKSAVLSAPYAPILTFANSTDRTAQQLMADVLTFNAVPLGWDIDWQLEDWLVPAGAFTMQGTYIEGLNAIAGAAGAYLQPHATAQEISVLLRYPVAPWDWDTVTPDFELPAAVTSRESIEWLDKPDYNRVYVSGTSQGVLARVTKGGTDGALAAQMVTDPLITAAAAGRQRGLAVLGDTGRQARVGLRLPVLDETGVITPGKFVRYVDGGDERVGIVRSTSVEVGYPEVWQQLMVETHE